MGSDFVMSEVAQWIMSVKARAITQYGQQQQHTVRATVWPTDAGISTAVHILVEVWCHERGALQPQEFIKPRWVVDPNTLEMG